MILAISVMSAGWRAFFYVVAFVAVLIGLFAAVDPLDWVHRQRTLAVAGFLAGACVLLVQAWDAVALGW